MKELEKAIDQLKKENDRIEKAQNRAKLLNQKINKLKRNAYVVKEDAEAAWKVVSLDWENRKCR